MNDYNIFIFIAVGKHGPVFAENAKTGKLQMVKQSLLPSEDCKKMCK